MTISCFCGKPLELDQSADTTCQCGRTYNARGQYLWRIVVTDIPDEDVVYVLGEDAHGERRAEDQDTAIEEAFIEGKLPEVDRRDSASPEPERAPAKPTTGRKKKSK